MNFSFKGMFDPANERFLPLLSYETRAKVVGIAVFQESTFQNGLNFDFFKKTGVKFSYFSKSSVWFNFCLR